MTYIFNIKNLLSPKNVKGSITIVAFILTLVGMYFSFEGTSEMACPYWISSVLALWLRIGYFE